PPPLSVAVVSGVSSLMNVLGVRTMRAVPSVRGHEVHGREDEDPHDVDEVPIETGDLDRFGVLGTQLALHRARVQREQPDDADRYVGAVQTGEHVERGTEEVRLEVQALA